jgi:hypothetical protein
MFHFANRDRGPQLWNAKINFCLYYKVLCSTADNVEKSENAAKFVFSSERWRYI